jgi:hypothetical protein
LPTVSPYGTDFLSREWPLLIESCSFARNPEKIARLAEEIRDSESLLLLAEEHGVLGHLTSSLASAPASATLFDALRARRRVQLLFTLTMTAELFRMLKLFCNSATETVVVKGPVLSQRGYGDPAARQYVDLDLLVRHSDIRRAAEILIAAGYESRVPEVAIRSGKIPGEYLFRRPGTMVIFELHTEHSFRYFPLPLPIEDYFQNKTFLSLDNQSIPALSSEHEFVLICIHGAKHFWERLMWISDVAAMVHNHPSLDWPLIRQYAAEVGAGRMLRVALLLAEQLLGVAVPAPMKIEVARDSACARLVREIETWLPYGGYATPRLMQRARFRLRMCEDLLAGAAYLARLSFSPTEEDWVTDAARRSDTGEILRRPFRLAKKYRRNPDS